MDGVARLVWQPELFGRVQAVRFAHDSKSLFVFFGGVKEAKPNTLVALQIVFELPFDPVIRRFVGEYSAIHGVAVPDEKHLITWNGSPNVSIWDLQSRKEIAVLQAAPKNLLDITLSPRGTILATAGDDAEIKFWDWAKQELKQTKQPYCHDDVRRMQFSKDGKYLITASNSGLLKVWDAPEFAWDEGMNPERIEISADGTIRDVFPDGLIRYRKIDKDAE